MKKLFFFLFLYSAILVAQNTERTISGVISDGNSPVASVSITNESTNKQIFSNETGNYKITASPGDVVKYSHQGMKDIRIRIEDVTRVLNPTMIPDVEELDEVIVKGVNRKSREELDREYIENKSLIKTAYGMVDARRAPGHVRFLHEDDINDVSICILNMLRNRFANVQVFGDCSVGGGVVIRGAGSINNPREAVYDVDGMILYDAPIWLIPSSIHRVAIFSSLSMSVKYGFLGGGGVVVINTKAGSQFGLAENGKPYDQAKLRNNFVEDQVLTELALENDSPTYLKEFRASQSLEAAKQVYGANAKKYANSPYYFLDAYRYFYDRWNDAAYADRIIGDNYGLFENNAVLLKALAYHYESQERYEKAHELFKEVFILRPNYAQSYMDIANSYRGTDKLQQAASIYTRYDYLLDEGFMQPDTVGFGPIIDREFNNLLMLNKGSLVSAKKTKKLLLPEEEFNGTRLVFEWNDSEAEFELQFVNPLDQYYKWKHSLADNSDAIMSEKVHGYACTEHLIDGSMPGEWKVNVTYLGNKSLTPTYLKATIYHNYGAKEQRKEVKVFKLRLKNVDQQLFTIQKSASVVNR